MHSCIQRVLLTCLLLLAVMLSGAATAQQTFSTEQFDPRFATVVEAITAGDHDAADKALKALRRTAGNTADYHFLEGVVTALSMGDASAIRLPFIVRRMRNQWTEALKQDPNHELALFSLVQFHANAPGLVGGSQASAIEYANRLRELNSPFQYSTAIVIAQMHEDTAAEEAAWQQLFAAQPDNLEARYNYISSRINREEYANALAQLEIAVAAINAQEEPNAQLAAQLRYQWGKLAAVSGQSLEIGANYLNAFIVAENLPDGISLGWVHFRLAQIYFWQNNDNAAQAHLSSAEQLAQQADNADASLQTALANVSAWCATNATTC